MQNRECIVLEWWTRDTEQRIHEPCACLWVLCSSYLQLIVGWIHLHHSRMAVAFARWNFLLPVPKKNNKVAKFIVHSFIHSFAHPPGNCYPLSPGVCNLWENLSPGVWAFVNSSRIDCRLKRLTSSLFQYFTLRHVYLESFRSISIKNIFNNCAVKRYVWLSLHHFPILQYFFASV